MALKLGNGQSVEEFGGAMRERSGSQNETLQMILRVQKMRGLWS